MNSTAMKHGTLRHDVAVSLQDVHVSFGDNRVLSGLNLDVRQGEILSLIGASGCGKSVLLKVIIGLVRAQKGRVIVEDQLLNLEDEEGTLAIRRQVGMVFQGGALFDSLDVFDNIAYPLRERGVVDPPTLRKRVAEVLEMIGLPQIEKKMPAQLSGGMRKRVALGRAIAEAPRILLYDEPTTGLDPINVRRISELISDLRDRLAITSIVVTHDLASASMISDRIAMVDERKIIAVDSTAAMRKSPLPRVRTFLEAMPLAQPEAWSDTAR